MTMKNEFPRPDQAIPLRERLRPLQDRVLSWPATGEEANKTFYDDINGDPEGDVSQTDIGAAKLR